MFGKKKYEVILKIEGMSCTHCSARVEKLLNDIPGITAKVDLKKGLATVKSDEKIQSAQLCEVVTNAGYPTRV